MWAAISRAFGLAVIGALLLGWVALCAAVFWYLYTGITATQPDGAIAAVEGMMWPFTVVVIGIPFLMLLSFGGLRAINELVALQKMVTDLPKDIEAMRSAVQVFRAIKDDLAATRAEIGLASSEISQAQASNETDAQGSDQPDTERVIPEYVKRFDALYRDAKSRYRRAVKKYVQENPNDSSFNPGDDWIEIIAKLRDLKAGYFDPGKNRDKWVADWIIKMIESERTTRRDRSGRLNDTKVKALEEEAPKD